MTAVGMLAQQVAGAVLLLLLLVTIDTAFLSWASGCEPRHAVAFVLYAQAAIFAFVETDAVTSLGVWGHIAVRALLYPVLGAVGCFAVWVLT